MNAAIVGYGYWGKIIRKYIDASKEFDLVRVCSLGILQDDDLFTDKLDDIIHDANIDTVFVCTPIATHYEICKALLVNKKHVFCEKPLTKSMIQLEELYKIAELNKRVLYTDYIYTVSKSIEMMKKLSQKIGTICCIEGEISQFGNFYPEDNVFEVLGVHLFSVLADILPDCVIEKYEVTTIGKVSEKIGKLHLWVNKDVQVYFTCSLLNAKKIRLIKIYGTSGSIVFDMMDTKATVRFQEYDIIDNGCYKKGEESEWMFDEKNNLEYVIRDFSNVVTHGTYQNNVNVSRKVNEILACISSC